MLKKVILPSLALSLLATSCDFGNKDSSYTVPFTVYNVITDVVSSADDVQFSPAVYTLKHNVTKDVISFDVSNLSVGGQKVSFETDPMSYKIETFKMPSSDGGSDSYQANWTFGGRDITASGASIDYFSGKINWYYIPGTSNQLNPYFQISTAQGLNLSYQLNERYTVQTINPYLYFVGTTSGNLGGQNNMTDKFNYFVELNFISKEATINVYNRNYDSDNQLANPQMLRIQGVKFVTSHNGFSLQADAPKTQVKLKDDQGKEGDLAENADYQVTDFSLTFMSADYTQAYIKFKLAGKDVSFQGTCIVNGTPMM